MENNFLFERVHKKKDTKNKKNLGSVLPHSHAHTADGVFDSFWCVRCSKLTEILIALSPSLLFIVTVVRLLLLWYKIKSHLTCSSIFDCISLTLSFSYWHPLYVCPSLSLTRTFFLQRTDVFLMSHSNFSHAAQCLGRTCRNRKALFHAGLLPRAKIWTYWGYTVLSVLYDTFYARLRCGFISVKENCVLSM